MMMALLDSRMPACDSNCNSWLSDNPPIPKAPACRNPRRLIPLHSLNCSDPSCSIVVSKDYSRKADLIFYLIIKSVLFLKKEKIDILVSTGGYMSLPLCLGSKILNPNQARNKLKLKKHF